jgi:Actin
MDSEVNVKQREDTRKELEHDTPVVFDIGTTAVRAGFAGEEAPEAKIRMPDGACEGSVVRDWDLVGGAAERALRDCGLGEDVDFDVGAGGAGGVVGGGRSPHTGGEIDLRGRAVLFTVPLFAGRAHEDRLREIAFERLSADNLIMMDVPLLSLYSHGRTTGISVNWGAGSFQAKAIFEGHELRDTPGAAARHEFGTHDLARSVQDSLRRRADDPIELDFAAAEHVLERTARCAPLQEVGFGALNEEGRRRAMRPVCRQSIGRGNALPLPPAYPIRGDYAGESDYRSFQLPDGSQLRLSAAERARMAEPAFCSGESDSSGAPRGFADIVWRMLSSCPVDIRDDLAQNIVCGGGLTELRGFAARAREEVTAVLPEINKAPRVITDSEFGGILAAWIGGSIIASLEAGRDAWERNPLRGDA